MNCEEANKISISGFLSSLGIQPVKMNGNSLWYLSPLRKEKTPSFKVDEKLNRWFDHGLGQGGKLVDLGVRLLNSEVTDLLDKLSKNDFKSFSFQKPELTESPKLVVKKIKALENNALVSYLGNRGIPSAIAARHCEELYYQLGGKSYFAIAFKNDSDGFEIRNKYFKACIGTKDITTICPGSDRVILFEGFIDFLSGVKQLQLKMSGSSFIVLNSVNQIEKAKNRISEIGGKIIEAYFDNDDAGRQCLAVLKQDFPSAIDRSITYRQHKDLNDFLVSQKRIENVFTM